jgi:hypothetical protein
MTDSLDPKEGMDVVISSLDTTPTAPPARARDSAPPFALDAAITPSPPRTPKQRLVLALSLVMLFATVLAALFLIPPDNRAATLVLFGGPTSTPMRALEPGDDAFLWEYSVPWGQLLVDGQVGPDVRGSSLHADSTGKPIGAPFHLSRGRHTLQYRAPPFPTLACVVSVPATFTDTCPLDPSSASELPPSIAPTTRLLDLQASVEHLPPTAFQALADTTQAALTAWAASHGSGMIAVGDHYRDLTWEVKEATTPLVVEPQYRLDTPFPGGSPSCNQVCGGADFVTMDSSTDWTIHALVALTWRYSTPDGQVVVPQGPSESLQPFAQGVQRRCTPCGRFQ